MLNGICSLPFIACLLTRRTGLFTHAIISECSIV